MKIQKRGNKAAQALGSLGGKARAENLTADELSEIGRQGARSRWDGMSAEERRAATAKASAARRKK